MIVTVTLNPGPDRTLTVPAIRFDEVLRATALRLDWGGKGLNVSRALRVMGTPSVATGFAGGYAGQMITDGLEALGIDTQFVPIAGETRTNTVIIEEGTDRYIKVNEAGPTVSAGELARFLEKAMHMVTPGDVWVIGGRPPLGVPADTYPRLVSSIQAAGARVLLDTSGEYLRLGCSASPFLVKPNLLEAAQMLCEAPLPARPAGSSAPIAQQVRDLATSLEALDQVLFFLERDIALVALSMGPDGLLLAARERAVWARPPRVRVRNSVGAGDALMAGLAWALDRGMSLEEMARWGVAAGTASAMRERVGFDDLGEVEAILSAVELS